MKKEDIEKIRKSKGRCKKHGNQGRDLCIDCKEVQCAVCIKDHKKNWANHTIYDYERKGLEFKEELENMTDAKEDVKEINLDEVITKMIKKFKDMTRELEADFLSLINTFKDTSTYRNTNGKGKKSEEIKEKMDKLEKDNELLELYLFCQEVKNNKERKIDFMKEKEDLFIKLNRNFNNIKYRFIEQHMNIGSEISALCKPMSDVERVQELLKCLKFTEEKEIKNLIENLKKILSVFPNQYYKKIILAKNRTIDLCKKFIIIC